MLDLDRILLLVTDRFVLRTFRKENLTMKMLPSFGHVMNVWTHSMEMFLENVLMMDA